MKKSSSKKPGIRARVGKKGEATRERILDAAQSLILESGYAGVSVERLIASLGLTKGAFFHHFKSKRELARALIQRYAEQGVELFEASLARARKLSDDPLQQFDADIRPILNREFLLARHELTSLIERIAERYPPRAPIDATALADTFNSTFEGAFILSKSLAEPAITAQQLKLYKTFIEMLFRGGDARDSATPEPQGHRPAPPVKRRRAR